MKEFLKKSPGEQKITYQFQEKKQKTKKQKNCDSATWTYLEPQASFLYALDLLVTIAFIILYFIAT